MSGIKFSVNGKVDASFSNETALVHIKEGSEITFRSSDDLKNLLEKCGYSDEEVLELLLGSEKFEKVEEFLSDSEVSEEILAPRGKFNTVAMFESRLKNLSCVSLLNLKTAFDNVYSK